MNELIQAGIVRKLNKKDDMSSWFVNPVIILTKKAKLGWFWMLDIAITVTSNCSWLLEPLQVLMTRLNVSYFTSSYLSCAYYQVTVRDQVQILISFIVGGRQYTNPIGFYG